jgi:hypothetical protein
VVRGDILSYYSIRVFCKKGKRWGGGRGQEGGVNEVAGSNESLMGSDGTILVSLHNLCPEWEEGGSNSGELVGGGAVVFVSVKTAKKDSDITLIDCNSMS